MLGVLTLVVSDGSYNNLTLALNLGSYPSISGGTGLINQQAPLLPPTPQKVQPFRVGILGFGNFGAFMARHFIDAGH